MNSIFRASKIQTHVIGKHIDQMISNLIARVKTVSRINVWNKNSESISTENVKIIASFNMKMEA